VFRAAERGVTHLALTDHDGTEGIAEAKQAATAASIHLIPGVEISVSWHASTVHIVGLNVDIDSSTLQSGLSGLRAYRRDRAIAIAHKLEKAGIKGAYEGAREYASETMLGRMHFAQFLVASGHAKSIGEVFKHYLVKNKPGYVSSHWTSLEEALSWINESGGQAVIAHPARYKMTATKRRKLFDAFKVMGGAAVEVASGQQHPEEVRTMARLAEQFDLKASCGSDFHSPDSSWSDVGSITPLPPHSRPIWADWSV
jgi:hypothetical protein